MRRLAIPLCLTITVLLWVAGSAPLTADEELSGPALRAQVTRWLKDLRSDRFETREAARAGLEKYAEEARDLLEAARDDEDPEVRRTVRSLLAGATRTPTTVPAHVRPAALDRLGLVDLVLEERPLHEAFARLGRQMGGRFVLPEAARAVPVTIDVQARPCFEVLARLLAAGGLRMDKPFDASGSTALVALDERPLPPEAAAGPLLVQVLEVTATRALNAKGLPRYALLLQLQWAPSVQIGQYETPRIEVARDPDGNAFKAGAAMGRTTSYGVGHSSRSARVTVHLEPTSAECGEALGVLEIVLPIRRLQHDVARVSLADTGRIPVCLDPSGEVARPDRDEAVQFHSLERTEDTRGQWVADIGATLLAEVAQRTVQAFVVKADGTLQPLYVYGGRSRSADGTVRLTARALRGTAERPAALQVTWFRREEEGRLRFRLTDIPLR